ncbi:MAG TPA: TolC family protein, partial [Burkholderiaceae bacterium]|nr:TolC family protein [Burkholderiaceae bacterium]
MTRLLKTALIPLVAALALAGCASAPFAPTAAPAAPAAFKEDGAARFVDVAPAAAQPRGAWWTVFADPVLDDLVQRATASNTDVQQAAARVLAARALLRDAQADLLPQVGASVGASRATVQPGLSQFPGQAANLGT